MTETSTVLAITYHDPEGRLCEQLRRALPILLEIFSGLAVRASHASSPRSISLLDSVEALVIQEQRRRTSNPPHLGIARREAIALALKTESSSIMYSDGDRVLHWAERHPAELARVAEQLPECDFTVMGRTDRAFQSHPRVQRDTEAIINHVFEMASGKPWDVTAGARGLSRRSAEAILKGCFDEDLSTDVSWPLYLRSLGGFSFAYLRTEGLEFETPDRYGREIEDAGGHAEWMRQFDSDVERWVGRLDLARGHVAAMLPYVRQGEGL
jgi:hypothetical protein